MNQELKKKTKQQKKFLFFLFSISILLIGVFIFINEREKEINKQPTVFIDNTPIFVEIAKDADSRATGLSNRPSLASDSGMLFLFPQAGLYSFWMPDMNFPLDIIWLDENKTIIAIDENVPPLEDSATPKFYRPPSPAKYVLEVNAGFIKKHNIKIQSSKVIFKNMELAH